MLSLITCDGYDVSLRNPSFGGCTATCRLQEIHSDDLYQRHTSLGNALYAGVTSGCDGRVGNVN